METKLSICKLPAAIQFAQLPMSQPRQATASPSHDKLLCYMESDGVSMTFMYRKFALLHAILVFKHLTLIPEVVYLQAS